jgi:hypothetical protein
MGTFEFLKNFQWSPLRSALVCLWSPLLLVETKCFDARNAFRPFSESFKTFGVVWGTF